MLHKNKQNNQNITKKKRNNSVCLQKSIKTNSYNKKIKKWYRFYQKHNTISNIKIKSNKVIIKNVFMRYLF